MLSIYYLRIADSLLVGNPTIVQKILGEDLTQGLQGENCLFLAPPTFKEAFFPACFFKSFREYAGKKRTLKSLLQLLQHPATPPLYPPTRMSFGKTNSDAPQSGPQTNQSRAISIGLHPGVLMPRSYQSHKEAAAGSPKGALF